MSAEPSQQRVPVISGRARVGSYTARDGSTRDVELAYDVFGSSGRPLVLIMGIGAQRIFWDDEMCEQFVAAGFQAVRFDHRDVGESTRLDANVPPPMQTVARWMLNLPVAAPYSLTDMAHDVIALMDTIGFATAHVVGVSMGGMVAQHIAIEHPDRVRSLTTIMSSPGSRRYFPQPRVVRAMFGRGPKTEAEAGDYMVKLFDVLGGKWWPHDVARLRAVGQLAHARGRNPRGFLRHIAAVARSGDRRPHLPALDIPTLVIHGSRDPMLPLRAGKRLAALIPNATWLPIAGMGHHIPEQLFSTLVAAIARHAERADSRATV